MRNLAVFDHTWKELFISFSLILGGKDNKYELTGFFGNGGHQGKKEMVQTQNSFLCAAAIFLTVTFTSPLSFFLHRLTVAIYRICLKPDSF